MVKTIDAAEKTFTENCQFPPYCTYTVTKQYQHNINIPLITSKKPACHRTIYILVYCACALGITICISSYNQSIAYLDIWAAIFLFFTVHRIQKPNSWTNNFVEGSGHNLKGAQVWDFWPIFFTPINPIWVGDLRTGEKKIFFEDHGRYSPFCFFYAGWACAKNLPTQAEPALKNCLRRLSLR